MIVIERGANVFGAVCKAADAAEFIRSLEHYAWQDLYSWLLRNYSESGVTGEILGLMLVEGAERFSKAVGGKE